MGTEQCKNGKSYCEIDEYKIIDYSNETRWMFGIYDKGTQKISLEYFLQIIIELKILKTIQKKILNLLQIQIAKNILNFFQAFYFTSEENISSLISK